MEQAKQVELIKSWGFRQTSHDETMYIRNAPQEYLEVWSINAPNYIDIYNKYGNLTSSNDIHWKIVEKHFD
jgi:hypothetical protein